MKKYVNSFFCVLIVLMMIFSAMPAWAQGPQKEVIKMKFTVGEKVYELQDVPMPMDAPPILIEGWIMLPIRYVVEPLYAQLHWDESTKRIWILSAKGQIELRVGQNKAKINGEEVYIDANNPRITPMIIDGRTMLPLRFVVENLDGKIKWNEQTKEITVNAFRMPPSPMDVRAFMIARENEAMEQEAKQSGNQMAEQDKKKRENGEERRKLEEEAIRAANERKRQALKEEDQEVAEYAHNYRRDPKFPYLVHIDFAKGDRMKDAVEKAIDRRNIKEIKVPVEKAVDIKNIQGMKNVMGKAEDIKKLDIRMGVHQFSFMECHILKWSASKDIVLANLNRGIESAPRIVSLLVWSDLKGKGAMNMPITDIAILRTNPEDPRIGNEFEMHHNGKSRWYCHPQNLNEGTNAEALYLIYTKDGGEKRYPVTDLMVTNSATEPPGWERVHYAGETRLANLNEGAKGEFLFFFMKRSEKASSKMQ